MRSQVSCFLATTALTAPLFFMPALAGAETKIGTVAAVNPAMAGTPPGSKARTLALGLGVIQNERVETRGEGSGQLLFMDQSTLTVAPNSDIVLDKFVYDPDQQAGEMAVTMTKGVLRLIGGRITKNKPAIIKTPTATIGVRGGMALLIVGADGSSRICNIAGEFVEVTPTAGGGKITLSRPNACAVTTSSGGRFDGLIKSTKLAEYYELLEGNGDGGRNDAIAAANTTTVAKGNSGVKGGEDREPVSTSGHSSPSDRSARDDNQPSQDERIAEIAFTDQELNDLALLDDNVPIDNDVFNNDDIFDDLGNDDIGNDLGNDDFDLPVITGLSGGSVQDDTNDGVTVSTFDEVLEGSLIGSSIDGSVTIPVPNTGDNASVFDTTNILEGFANPQLSNVIDVSGGELFTFTGGFFDDATGEIAGGGFSDLLGPIAGIGLTNSAEEFTYVEFTIDDGQSDELNGVAFFGNATQDRGLFYQGNLAGTVFNDAEFDPATNTASINPALLNDDLVNGVSNTAEGFVLTPNFLDAGDFEAPPQPLFMVGNEGFARFASDVTIDTGNSGINGDDLVGGGKWLFAGFLNGEFVDEDGSVRQESAFQVIADDIKSLQGQGTASGPILSATAFGTSQFALGLDFDGGGSVVGTQSVDAVTANIGNLEDGTSQTQFGEDNRFMVLSSVVRDGSDLLDPALNPGSSTELFPDFEGGSGGTTLLANQLDVDPFVSLTARDAKLSERINEPLALARARAEVIDGIELSGGFDRGFMTGFARCEGGQCGDEGFGSGQFVFPTGTYPVITGNPDFNTFTFDDVSNEVEGFFDLRMIEPGDVAFVEATSSVRFGFGAGGATSAFIDDERFALVEIDGSTTIGGSGGDRIDASFATQGLAGTEGLEFPDGTQTDHEFLRWGYWSANYEVQVNDDGNTSVREDILHAGTFVTGLRPDEVLDNLPTDLEISYSGFAVGTTTSLFPALAPETAIVAGTFDMTFDFGSNRGAVTIDIPNAAPQFQFDAVNINETIPVTGQQLTRFSGSFENNALATATTVNGGFFASPDRTNPTNGVAAVGGDFTHVSLEGGFQTVGNFGGSAVSARPSPGGNQLTSQVGVTGPGGTFTGRPGGIPGLDDQLSSGQTPTIPPTPQP